MHHLEKEYLGLKGYKNDDSILSIEEVCYVCQSPQTTYEGLSSVDGGYLHTTEILPRSKWCNKTHPSIEFNLIERIDVIIS
jgi:hypothetical protein